MAPGQSLCKALKMLKIYSCRDAKSSRAKPSLQPVNLPGAQLLMKSLEQTSENLKTQSRVCTSLRILKNFAEFFTRQ